MARYLYLFLQIKTTKQFETMKKFYLLVIVALVSAGVVNACKKPKAAAQTSEVGSTQSERSSDLTIIVMDSTQALLDGAEVQFGKTRLRSSWDGRLVLKRTQLEGIKSLTIKCKGFDDQPLTLPAEEVNLLIVRLKAKPGKTTRHEGRDVYYSYSRRDGDYRSMALTKTASADRELMVEEAMVGAAVEMDGAMEMSSRELPPEPMPSRPDKPGKPASNGNISAGKLTAGEVNDFAKWYFWPKVLDETHKEFIGNWRLTARHRYTVQVTDRHGYPIAARAVSLTDQNGNTLFQAVTDNTGKAELWYQFISNNLCGKHAGLNIRVDDQVIPAKDYSEGLNTVVLDEECTEARSGQATSGESQVDVVFVFDATGSMGDELRYLQAEMKDVIARAKEATGGLNIRTGAVVYRDHGDEYVTRISRLTTDISTTQAFIDNQHANGGGDYPEAVPEALMAALNSSGWNEDARARIAFLVLDAPCHQDSATIALLHEQILNAAALGVRIVPVVCSGLGESGELLLRSMALATNGTSFFLTDDSGIGHSHLKPTTDTLKVEHLNDMLVRTIVEFSYMPDCTGHWHQDEIENVEEQFVPNPFSAQEIEKDPTIQHGPEVLYLLDVSGKLITVYNGRLEDAGDSQLSGLHIHLSTGIYFIKAFYDGQWHTKKILVH